MPDYRSPEAAAYRRLYNTRQWKTLRANQLNAKPLCEWCNRRGRIVAATIADHAIPHKGDETLFFNGDLISLCKPCHDTTAQVRDNRGFSPEVGADGFPIDPRHRAIRG
jgi:5-methylcytosine-specific restriction protein A